MKLIAQRLSQKLVQQTAVSKQIEIDAKSDGSKSTPLPSTSAVASNEVSEKKVPAAAKSGIETDPSEIASTSPDLNSFGASENYPHKDELKSNNEFSKTKKKKHKRKKNYFEGEYVPYLVKSKTSKHKENDDDGVKADDDEYVLKKLFTKSGMSCCIFFTCRFQLE